MTERRRRGVTRGYVWGLIFAVSVLAVSLIVAGWGLYAYASSGDPISTAQTPLWVGPLNVLLCLGLLVWGLWQQSLWLLRGRVDPPWGHVLMLATGGYLLWCLLGLLEGLAIVDTWVSPYALMLGLVWGVSSLVCWTILMRRIYTERPVPKWPWERRQDGGAVGESGESDESDRGDER